jgi:hypothetical protein
MSNNTQDDYQRGKITRMCETYAKDAGFFLIATLIYLVAIVISTIRNLSRLTGRLHAFLMRRVDDHSTEDQ